MGAKEAIQEMLNSKYNLEEQLRNTINIELGKFRETFGISIKEIKIQMVDITHMDSVGKEFLVGKLETKLAIDE
jgi:hypothetical protein